MKVRILRLDIDLNKIFLDFYEAMEEIKASDYNHQQEITAQVEALSEAREAVKELYDEQN